MLILLPLIGYWRYPRRQMSLEIGGIQRLARRLLQQRIEFQQAAPLPWTFARSQPRRGDRSAFT